MSREKVSVLIGICGNASLVGPIFNESTLTGAKYLDLLTERIIPELHQIYHYRFNRLWWIQDGAPAHGSRAMREFLQGVFTDGIIALHHAIEWPPISPDLTPCDYFFWGRLKNKVYSTPPEDTGELRERILNEVNLLKANRPMVRRVIAGMRRKLQLWVERNGIHVEGN